MSTLGFQSDPLHGLEDEDPQTVLELLNETKKLAARYVSDLRYQEAVNRYSEVILQARTFSEREKIKGEEEEKRVKEVGSSTTTTKSLLEDDATLRSKKAQQNLELRQIIQSCYLNLSLCFLKISEVGPDGLGGKPDPMGEFEGKVNPNNTLEKIRENEERVNKGKHWCHCMNAATRALLGDEEPPNPRHAEVLDGKQRGKAIYRRCLAGERWLDMKERKADQEGSNGDSDSNTPPPLPKLQVSVSYESLEKDLKSALQLLDTPDSEGGGSDPKMCNDIKKLLRTVVEKRKKEDKAEKERMGNMFKFSNKEKEGKDSSGGGKDKDTSSNAGGGGTDSTTDATLDPSKFLSAPKGQSHEARSIQEKKKKDLHDQRVKETVARLQQLQIHKTLEESQRGEAGSGGIPLIDLDDPSNNGGNAREKSEDELFFDEVTRQLHEMREGTDGEEGGGEKSDFAKLKEIVRRKCEEEGCMPDQVFGKEG